jgi:hypothetical protein
MVGKIRKHLSYANVAATLALFVAMGGTAAASVIVHSNSDIAGKTVSGHAPPPGKHANLIGGSVNAKDLSPDLKASLTLHCPAGMQQGFDICFEPTTRPPVSFLTALQTCQTAGRRLPSIAEVAEILDNLGTPQNEGWTDDYFVDGTDLVAIIIGDNDSRAIKSDIALASIDVSYRCVVGPGT